MIKRILLTAVAAAVIVVSAALFVWLRDNSISNFEGPADIYVRPGDNVECVMSQIKNQTKIRSEASLKRVFNNKDVEGNIKPGHYAVKRGTPSVRLARALNNGWQTPVKLTLSGSLRLKSELASKIAAQMMVDSLTVSYVLNDNEALKEFGVNSETVFSIILPDTYEVYWTDGMGTLLQRFKAVSDEFWTAERLEKAKGLKLSRQQVCTLASIVRSESKHIPEYRQIAGVYVNRLRRGQKLQADPTVAFCFDYKPGRILKKHLAVESKYNTYKYAGLPPGPICCPSRAAINAVLDADTASGYMFFCASPAFDGTHRFARTYSEHLKNAKAFQNALDKLK